MATPVDPIDPAKKTSRVTDEIGDEITVSMDLMNAKCIWNDQEFTQGDRIENDGKCYECTFGRWVMVGDDD